MAKAQQSARINATSVLQPASNEIFRLVWCADHHFTGPWPCGCLPGPQFVGFETTGDEIGAGGARGGSKTELVLAWLAFKGNPARVRELRRKGKDARGADVMYIAHRNYRGLLLREQANDLVDLLDRAEEMYGPTGATISRGNPSVATWKTGAKIVFGHFGDNGWKKYIGPQYQRIGIDQAEMIPNKEIHDRIMGSCRSKWGDLVPQMMMTFNPGGGDELSGAPGQAWLMDFFRIEAYEAGKLQPGQLINDEHGKTRTFIASKVRDNPYLKYYVEREKAVDNPRVVCQNCQVVVPLPVMERKPVAAFAPEVLKRTGFDLDFPADTLAVCSSCSEPVLRAGGYYKWLNSIEPESLRAAWRDGDWHALSGVYFRDFRPNGPLKGEPDNARHVYKPENVRLEPWFHAWGSLDWGYIHPSAFYLHRKSTWGQTYTEKEIVLSRVEPFELGVLLARELRSVLLSLPGHHVNIYTSPDAYAKRESENTVASQIVAGISKELGPGTAFLADLTDEEREMKSDDALESLKRRRKEQSKTLITLLRANTDRVAGWMHMQTMLRFRSLSKQAVPDKDFANNLYREYGLVKYMEYMNGPDFKADTETLPKWQISAECKHLIATLPTLMHKPGTNDVQKIDATETRPGDDSADCCFVAGTMVRTKNGEKPIEGLRVGEKVWTREGLRPILATGKPRTASTFRVSLSSGTTITGTSDHPIWVEGFGWKSLDSLRYGDKIFTWQKLLSLMDSNSAAIQTQNADTCESTTGPRETIDIKASGLSMSRFTSLTMGLSRQNITSTIKTKIRSIMSPIISKLFRVASTTLFTAKNKLPISNYWHGFALLRSSGMGLMLDWNGTVSMQPEVSPKHSSRRKWHAKNVPANLFQKTDTNLSSVERHVSNERCERDRRIGLLPSAPSAELISRPTNTNELSVAPISVLGLCDGGEKPVFNLQVSETPEYFANGILVHNCRYGLFSEERQGSALAPLEERITGRVDTLLAASPGMSTQSQWMAERVARAAETKPNRGECFTGRNRMAVRRAFLASQHGKRDRVLV